VRWQRQLFEKLKETECYDLAEQTTHHPPEMKEDRDGGGQNCEEAGC
jgi:hypothetical protein